MRRRWVRFSERTPHYQGCWGRPEQNGDVAWCPRCGSVKVGKGDWRNPIRAEQNVMQAKGIVEALDTLRRALNGQAVAVATPRRGEER